MEGVLLITGGTGSFGHAVLRRFLDSNVAEIRIFSRDEKKQDDMRKRYAGYSGKLSFHLGDVRDLRSLAPALRGVDYCFHAAALKQVPSCEFHPMEAVRTNVIGTENVITAAAQSGVKKLICLSTDKAVYPINAMGMSKAMMEKVMVASSRSAAVAGTVLCGTRYGNVMASRGSVIPLFVEQILAGDPITITDPRMTRFMMTLEDAVELVMYAFEHGNSGDIFVQKAPAASVDVLVKALLGVFDKPDHPVNEIGTRHGEKLYETLLSREEMASADELGGFFRIAPDGRDMNYAKYFEQGEHRITVAEEYSSHNTRQLGVDEMAGLLRGLEYIQRALRGEPRAMEY